MKKKPSRDWKLYVITPGLSAGLETAVRDAVRGGADVIQLRDKKAPDEAVAEMARKLLAITRPAGVPLIINDRPRVAAMADADGVHLGQDDGLLTEARRIVGEGAIIGRSTHSAEQAKAAEAEGFDYIGVGPVFATPTKPGYPPVGLELVRYAASSIGIPFVAIGGIDASNARTVRNAGARTIAVVRAVLGSPDPRGAASKLLKEMGL